MNRLKKVAAERDQEVLAEQEKAALEAAEAEVEEGEPSVA